MAETVDLKLGVCFDCDAKTFTLTDETGPQHLTTNPLGWAKDGSGSELETEDVTSSGLTITSPNGVIYGPYSLYALTITTATFVVPAIAANVTVSVSNSSPYAVSFAQVGDVLNIQTAGLYSVVSVSSNELVLTNTGAVGNASATTVIAVGSGVGLSGLPSLTGATITIDPTNILGLGVGEAFSDGVWTFDWTVQGENDAATPFYARCVVERFPLCTVQCCVNKLVAKGNCNCGSGGNKDSQNAYLTLVSADGAWKNGQKEAAKKHLGRLEDICNNNCKDC